MNGEVPHYLLPLAGGRNKHKCSSVIPLISPVQRVEIMEVIAGTLVYFLLAPASSINVKVIHGNRLYEKHVCNLPGINYVFHRITDYYLH